MSKIAHFGTNIRNIANFRMFFGPVVKDFHSTWLDLSLVYNENDPLTGQVS